MPGAAGELAIQFLGLFIFTNLVLGLFNLLPIPPLDGGRIVVGVLPAAAGGALGPGGAGGDRGRAAGGVPAAAGAAGVRHRVRPGRATLMTVIPRATDLVMHLAGYDV